MTVTAPSFASPLEQVRWNMNLPVLRRMLIRKVRRALPARSPFAWAVGFQKRGAAHIHFTYALGSDGSAEVFADGTVEELVAECSVVDDGDAVDINTGEIFPFEITHGFGTRNDFRVAEATRDLAESAGYYLGQNAVEYPPTHEDLYEIADSQFDRRSRHSDRFGFSGARFRTSRDWGYTLEDRQLARVAMTKEQAAQLERLEALAGEGPHFALSDAERDELGTGLVGVVDGFESF